MSALGAPAPFFIISLEPETRKRKKRMAGAIRTRRPQAGAWERRKEAAGT
jgi:hypothetical protein